MISEWPINSDAGRPARPAPTAATRALGRVAVDARRLEEASADLFLDPARRLSDRVRALGWAMRDGLVEGVERDLRLFLAPNIGDEAVAASLSSASVAIASPLLADTNALLHPPFAAILLRRANETVIGDRVDRPDADRGALHLADPDAAVAQAAMALLLAEGGRRDRFGEPVLLLDDLPAELAAWLAWRVAAALRHYLAAFHDLADAKTDATLTAAVASILAEHDEGRGLNAAASRLAMRLSAAGRVDGTLLEALASSGQVATFTAALAAVLHLPDDAVWTVVADPAEARLATLLRAAGLERTQAAAVLLTLNDADAGAALDAFDACDLDGARAAIAPLGLDPGYRAAIGAFDTALLLSGTRLLSGAGS